MTKDKALKLALESLEYASTGNRRPEIIGPAITAIKEALAQPLPDLTAQQRESYQKGHNDGVAHHKQAVKAAQPEQKQTGIREIRVTETVKQEQEEDWDAMGQKILVATARDTKRTWEDAAVKAVHKLMQEEQEPVGFYVYKPTLPRGHLGNVSDGDLPWVYDQDPSSGYSARMLVYTTPLAQPKQEPVAWMCNAFDGEACEQSNHDECENPIPLYATPPKRQPLTDDEINKCDMCGYVGKDKDSIGQCPKCRWDELRPLVEKARQKPLTDDQIYDMYNEPRSDAEMLEFARAIEAAHGIKEQP